MVSLPRDTTSEGSTTASSPRSLPGRRRHPWSSVPPPPHRSVPLLLSHQARASPSLEGASGSRICRSRRRFPVGFVSHHREERRLPLLFPEERAVNGRKPDGAHHRHRLRPGRRRHAPVAQRCGDVVAETEAGAPCGAPPPFLLLHVLPALDAVLPCCSSSSIAKRGAAFYCCSSLCATAWEGQKRRSLVDDGGASEDG